MRIQKPILESKEALTAFLKPYPPNQKTTEVSRDIFEQITNKGQVVIPANRDLTIIPDKMPLLNLKLLIKGQFKAITTFLSGKINIVGGEAILGDFLGDITAKNGVLGFMNVLGDIKAKECTLYGINTTGNIKVENSTMRSNGTIIGAVTATGSKITNNGGIAGPINLTNSTLITKGDAMSGANAKKRSQLRIKGEPTGSFKCDTTSQIRTAKPPSYEAPMSGIKTQAPKIILPEKKLLPAAKFLRQYAKTHHTHLN